MALRTSEDERSKIDENYSKGTGSYLSEAERTALDDIENNYDQNADPSQENENIERTRDRESNPGWKTNITKGGKSGQTGIKGKAGAFVKRRSALLIAGVLGVGVIVVCVVLLGPAVLLPAMASNLIAKNDTSSRLFQARFTSTFRGMVETDESTCPNTSKSFRCKSSRVSNQLLSDLADRGVVAEGVSQNEVKSKKGYPTSRPTSYTVNIPGGSPRTGVAAKDLIGVINENSRLKANILGSRGILTSNKIWGGKHIGNIFFKPNNLDRTSALSKLANDTSLGRKATFADFRDKMKARISNLPGITTAPNLEDTTKTKIKELTDKASRGGGAYLIAAGSCIVSKAPSLIAAGIAAAQVAQVMPFVQDMILAPEGRLRAAGSEEADKAFSASEAEMIGTALTEKVAREDGKLTSATDSKYLQYAMGINTANVPPSELSPGLSVLHDGAMRASLEAGQAVKPACDVILSEPAIYTAMAADLAVTGVSAFVTGGLSGIVSAGARVVGTYAIVTGVTAAVSGMVANLAEDVFTKMAGELPEARGEKLGDILGVSALTFFGAGNLANMSTVMRESDVATMNASVAKLEEEEKENDIALLSPLDASSKHTFIGSIVHSIQTTAIANNLTSGSLTGSVKSIFGTSLGVISGSQAKADTSTKCYGKEFALSGDNPVCLNAAGLPVSYQTATQANMSTPEAWELIDKSGWIDSNVDIADNASLQEMVGSGYIKKDTLLSSWIETCGQDLIKSGDYTISADGCTTTPSTATVPSGGEVPIVSSTGSKEQDDSLTEDDKSIEASVESTDQRTLEAITPALVGFISAQTVNGENEEDFTAAPAAGGDSAIDGDSKQLAQMILDSGNVTGWDGDNGAGGLGVLDQLRVNAEGTASPDCVISPKLLKVLAGLTKNHSMTISDLSRNCANSNLSHSAGGHWDRPLVAVDISNINGGGSPHNNIAFINELLSYVDSGENVIVGQSQCRGVGKLTPPTGVTVVDFPDACHHLHIGIKTW